MLEMDSNTEERPECKTGKKVELNANYKEEIWLIRESEIWLIAGKTQYTFLLLLFQ